MNTDAGYCAKHRQRISLSDGCPSCDEETLPVCACCGTVLDDDEDVELGCSICARRCDACGEKLRPAEDYLCKHCLNATQVRGG